MHAKRRGLAIVTFDQDYLEIAALLGPPPKVILLRKGNSGTLAVSHLLREHRDRVVHFLEDNDPAGPAILEIP
jgi:predicted nuclease of predicted toxin-antitoxin system